MPRPASRLGRHVFLSAALLQCTDACIDSDGDFYCTSLWYFWFGVFWFFIVIFAIVFILVNRYNKKKTQVDVEINNLPMPPPRAPRKPLPTISAESTA